MKDKKGGLFGIGGVLLVVLAIIALRLGGKIIALLGKVVLLGAGVIVFGIVAVVVIVLVMVFRRPGKGTAPTPNPAAGGTSTSARKGVAPPVVVEAREVKDTLSPEDRAVLDTGDRNLAKVRGEAGAVHNEAVREAANIACAQAHNILTTLREKPEAIPRVRQFLNYYLPTLGTILTKYREMEQNNMADAAMTDKVLSYLEDIRSAMKKQHRSLFEADILDLTVEMEAMTMAFRRDGLLTDAEMSAETSGDINLTL